MTLADLANLICTKLNQLDAEDVAACKLFLARRYEMIWNDQLWKDSLIDWTYTLPDASHVYQVTDSWLPQKQVLILPAVFDRVMAVRTNTTRMNVQTPEIFYRSDYDSFQNGGMLIDYLVLPPAVWEFDSAEYLRLVTNEGDKGMTYTADILEASDQATVGRYRQAVASSNIYLTQGLRIDAFTRASAGAGIGSLLVGPRDNHGVLRNQSTLEATFFFNDSTDGSGAAVPPVGGQVLGSGETVELPTTVASIKGPDGLWQDVPGPTFNGVATWTGSGWTVTGPVLITIATLPATTLVALRRLRLRLVGSVNAAQPPTVRVLGKARPNTLTDDNDSTALTGVDNALVAAAEFDMLQRERQYGKSQLKWQEFSAHLEQLKRQEVVQQAYNKRILPEEGYGNPYDLWSHPPLSF